MSPLPERKCKSCGMPILWGITEATGKRIPLDVEPVAGGNIDVREHDQTAIASFAKPESGVERFVSHFATCPDAARHRKKPTKGA